MRIALIPLRTSLKNPQENFKRFAEIFKIFVKENAPELVVLPECSFTGYLYEKEDLVKFGEPLNGFTTKKIKKFAKKWQTAICFGFVERNLNKFYNTAVLVDKNGKIQIVYRKISEKPPYTSGKIFSTALLSSMKIGVLICGDLFYSETVNILPKSLDLLIVPMARGFDKKSPDRIRWETKEREVYLEAIKKLGIKSVIVNALDEGIEEGSFGGAMVVEKNGELLFETAHGSDIPLIYQV